MNKSYFISINNNWYKMEDTNVDFYIYVKEDKIKFKNSNAKTILTRNGYRLNKSLFTHMEIDEIKKELTVRPDTENEDIHDMYCIYRETPAELIVPRYYGRAKYGAAEKELLNSEKINIKFNGEMRDFQIDIVKKCMKHLRTHFGGILTVPCGRGKCLKRGTCVILYSGIIKKIEDVKPGEYLMGDDSTPRKVLNTGSGREEMFEITGGGTSYTVNLSHILSLKNMNNNNIIDIAVSEYIKLDKKDRDQLRGYRAVIHFSDKYTEKDPYEYGKNIIDDNTIGYEYKCNTYEKRIKLITGIVNTFGYEIECNKLKGELINDIMYICRSVGFGVCIQRDILIIDPASSLMYEININSVGDGDYYGVEIDGNRRFILGDFTVTHNTVMAIKMACEIGLKTLVIVHKTFLLDQWIERIKQFTDARIGIIKQNKINVSDCDIIVGMIQSISMKEYNPEIFDDIGCVIYDECFVYNTEIITNNSSMKIGDIYEMHKNNEILPYALSYNIITQKFEYKRITFSWEKQANNIINITFYDFDRVITCTDSHLFLTKYGYIEAHKLKLTDDVLMNYDNKLISTRIKSIERVNKMETVYDIEVEDNHNFIIKIADIDKINGVIVHNCHHTASRVFSNSLYKTGAKYTIGLSATPTRADKLEIVTNWYLGDMMYREDMRENKQVVAKMIYYKSDNILFKEKMGWMKGRGMAINTIKMLSNLCILKERTQHIIDIINELRKDPERKILILSERKTHIHEMKNIIDAKIKCDIDAGIIEENEIKTYLYIGDSKKKERKEAEMYGDILFATYQLAQEGLDIERLNTIILATPKKNIIQSIGRIMRKILKTGDTRPLIIDFSDVLSVYKNQSLIREREYEKNKYEIENYYVINSKIITCEEYMKQEGETTRERTDYIPEWKSILDVSRVCDIKKEIKERKKIEIEYLF